MAIDFNDAERQSTGGGGDPIPDGVVAPVIINLRGVKDSKTGAKGLDLEFVVTEGEFARKKAFKWAGIAGNGSEGHDKMVAITKSFIRAVLESASGTNPDDMSPEARQARSIDDWEDLHGVEFLARFGIEKGEDFTDKRTGEVVKGKDKNTVFAVTSDDRDYAGFKPKRKAGRQPAMAGGAANGSYGSKPNWGART